MSKKRTIEEIQSFVYIKGGKFLSNIYANGKTKYKWQCSCGYIWESKWNDISQGHWCPKCARNIKLTIEQLNDYANTRGGVCLSTDYINSDYKYQWKCSNNHIWFASASILTNKQWCPYCTGHHQSIEDLKTFAINKGGKCLSNEYKGAHAKYEWECLKGYRWWANWGSIKYGVWCPHCSGKAKLNIEILKKYAKDKGGECLSEIYINNKTKYEWKCSNKNHPSWFAYAYSVLGKTKNWCSYCAKQHSKMELEIYNFVKSMYPDALNGKTRLLKTKSFELDVYIPSLRKAIEFDGIFWHKSQFAINRGSIERDLRKSLQCQERNISLLRIDEEEFLNDKSKVFDKINSFLKSP